MLSSIEYLTQIELKCSYENVIELQNSINETDAHVTRYLFKRYNLKFNLNLLELFLRRSPLIQEEYTGQHILRTI
jgi:Zn-finger domain-containing protein